MIQLILASADLQLMSLYMHFEQFSSTNRKLHKLLVYHHGQTDGHTDRTKMPALAK